MTGVLIGSISRVSRALIVCVLLAGVSLGVAETANAAGKTLRALNLETSAEVAGHEVAAATMMVAPEVK